MIKKLQDLDLNQKTVLVRCDFNVPMSGQVIEDDTRIQKALPTIQYLLNHHARVILMSHLGRPKEGVLDMQFSLKPIAERLSQLLQKPVTLTKNLDDCATHAHDFDQIVMLENVRFNRGEKVNDVQLAKQYAGLADVFVMDAFGTAHRAQASTTGVAEQSHEKALGLLMSEELKHLTPLINDPKKPLLAIIGGSKISTKLSLLQALLHKVDRLIIGGGMANTFLQAQGYAIGKSLTENSLVSEAKALLDEAATKNISIGLPVDVVVVKKFDPEAPAVIKLIGDIAADDIVIDVGPESSKNYALLVDGAKTIIWNGPVGIVEWSSAEKGTQALGKSIAKSNAVTIAGGGDTIAFINQHQLAEHLDYLSTGGGAFLAFLEGKTLPAVTALQSS